MEECVKNKIYSLVEKIEEIKKSDDDIISYQLSPYVKEMIAVIEQVEIDDKVTAIFVYKTYLYIAETYTRMVRFSLSAKYHFKALRIAKTIKEVYHYKVSGIEILLVNLLRDRNFYVDDNCEDVKEVVDGLLPVKKIENIFTNRLNHRRNLKNDPVEMSEEYLAVIDEVEERIAKNKTMSGMGSCHEIWDLKFQYLLEKGIKWKSPSLMNPRVMFD